MRRESAKLLKEFGIEMEGIIEFGGKKISLEEILIVMSGVTAEPIADVMANIICTLGPTSYKCYSKLVLFGIWLGRRSAAKPLPAKGK